MLRGEICFFSRCLSVEPDAMRVACPVRRRLCELILVVVASFVSKQCPSRVISQFYPMQKLPIIIGTWATLKNLVRICSQKAVVGKQVKILSTGPESAIGGRCNVASVGTCRVETHGIGAMTSFGVLGNQAGNSSTMKGP